MKKIFILFLFLATSIGFAYKPIVRLPELYSVRELGMGLAYTAVASDEMLLHANPAGIGVRKKLFQNKEDNPIFYFLPIHLEYSVNLFGILTKNPSELKNYFNLNESENGKASSVGINFPTDFSYVGSFWAISFISKIFANIADINSGNYKAQSYALSQLNVGFNVYSFSVMSREDLHIGVGAKFLYLSQANTYDKADEIINNLDLEQRIVDGENIQSILAETLNLYDGFIFGIDIGLLWEVRFGDTGHQLNVGITLQDIPSYAFSINLTGNTIMSLVYEQTCLRINERTEKKDLDDLGLCEYKASKGLGIEPTFLKPNPKFGLAYIMPNFLGIFFSDTTFAFDIHHIGDTFYSFKDMYHVGASTTIFDIKDKRTDYSYRINLSFGVDRGGFTFGYLIHLNAYMIAYNYVQEKMLGSSTKIPKHAFKLAFYF